MVNKKTSAIFLTLLFFVFSLSSVLAYNLRYYMDRAAYQIEPLAQFLLGGYDYTGFMLFERFLIFMIIFSMTFVALVKLPFFNNQRNAVILLSLVVPLLSVRYINFEWINTILLTYQVFGIALTSVLPFIIYFLFLIGIAPDYPGIRKIGWILFGCVYLGLYSTADNVFYGQVYLWTALAALAFFLSDKTIQNYFTQQKIKYQMNKPLFRHKMKLMDEQEEIIKNFGPSPSDSHAKKRLSEIENEIKEVDKQMKR